FVARQEPSLDRGKASAGRGSMRSLMEAEDAVRFAGRPRYILLVGAFAVGWSASRAIGAQSETQQPLAHAEPPVAPPDERLERDARRSWHRRPVRLALVG